ncbi:MAG: tetratricopeptide repeat protein [Pseudomonadota bacterium]
MKTNIKNTLTFAGITTCFLCSAGFAQDIQFFDGGYPEMCAAAARVQKGEDPALVELTGTRLGIEPIELCSLAIRSAETVLNRAASYNNRGVLLFAEGSIQEALSDFDAALSVDDSLAQAHVNRAYTLMTLMRWEDSIAAFDKGITLGSEEQAKAHYNRGIAHEELGHVREAYQDYLKASELNPLWEEPKQELMRFTVRTGTGG